MSQDKYKFAPGGYLGNFSLKQASDYNDIPKLIGIEFSKHREMLLAEFDRRIIDESSIFSSMVKKFIRTKLKDDIERAVSDSINSKNTSIEKAKSEQQEKHCLDISNKVSKLNDIVETIASDTITMVSKSLKEQASSLEAQMSHTLDVKIKNILLEIEVITQNFRTQKSTYDAKFDTIANNIAEQFLSNDIRSRELDSSIRNDISKKISGVDASIDSLYVKLDESINSNIDQVNMTIKEKFHDADDLMHSWSGKFTSLYEAYNEKIKLAAPVIYWREKSDNHKIMAKRWLITIIAMSVLGIVLAIFANFLIIDWLDQKKNQGVVTAALVLMSLPTLLYAIMMRVAHRSYRDQARHAEDAKQREVLVQTYLALIKEDSSHANSGERLLALHALFRGSAQFDSPDDTPPVNALEAIIQILKPTKGIT